MSVSKALLNGLLGGGGNEAAGNDCTAVAISPKVAKKTARVPGRYMRKWTQMRMQRRRWIRDNFLWIALSIGVVVQLAHIFLTATPDGGSLAGAARKLLNSTEDSYYPKEILDDEQKRNGWVFLHAVLLVYTFVALAFVCDEFFVPALERIVEHFEIPEDVAGATFMAAGGSAPELVTSFLGVFVSKSDVGFGTIIGSAVFNVLFVIGMCALFSKDLLVLTWWPLFRDCTFYAIDLSLLAWFFENDNKIAVWEAAIMLTMYVAYVGFMFLNEKVEKHFKRTVTHLARSLTFSAHVSTKMGHKAARDPMSGGHSITGGHAARPGKVHPSEGGSGTSISETPRSPPTPLADMNYDNSGAGSFAVAIAQQQLKASVEEARTPKAERRNSLSTKDLRFQRAVLMDVLMRREARMSVIIQKSMTEGGKPPSTRSSDESQEKNAKNEGEEGAMEKVAEDELEVQEEGEEEEGEEEEEEEGGSLDLSWPRDDLMAQINYVLTAPIVFSIWLTVPDVRREERSSWFPLAFVGAISWIGIISYPMVWMASIIGNTMGVSEEVMGITILAAGTSIPDLLSSVIVAQQGQGDMAVSSSIGSNIFDVTFGLPLPWFFWCLINNKAYPVTATTLKFSLILLLFMLVATVGTIAASGWKLTRTLGATMFCLYGVFILLSLLKNFGHLGSFLD
ncbi:sodium/calcium exchanger membrane region domain-containing protein [Pseudoscourfieldia marina]